MQSEESNTLVKLAKAVIEHAPEGSDAFWDIKFSDIEAALSDAEPEMNNAGSKCESLERSCTIDPDNDPKKENVYAAPPAPSVAVKAEQPEGTVGEMTPGRAIYFLERFKREEKMLGPHEQWALDFSIAALSAQVQDVAGWQPIETAPKDGSEILALWKRSQIQSNGYGVVWFEDGSWREFDYECLVSDPTHWMPLPSPPAAPSKQEG
ncbi:DUF551 domain-containing protein [Agrobacterium sp. CMT1]|uniref:DUF551 domain-containing protein n=1 Tax=Agrobacterium sp. CMT1 TaxID=3128901 RepID=UPI0030776B07